MVVVVFLWSDDLTARNSDTPWYDCSGCGKEIWLLGCAACLHAKLCWCLLQPCEDSCNLRQLLQIALHSKSMSFNLDVTWITYALYVHYMSRLWLLEIKARRLLECQRWTTCSVALTNSTLGWWDGSPKCWDGKVDQHEPHIWWLISNV